MRVLVAAISPRAPRKLIRLAAGAQLPLSDRQRPDGEGNRDCSSEACCNLGKPHQVEPLRCIQDREIPRTAKGGARDRHEPPIYLTANLVASNERPLTRAASAVQD